jgi:protocatechuate 3,4-dioxygenase beta subunit
MAVMTSRFNRRKALAGFGSVTLGSLLAACGKDEPKAGSQTTTAEVATTDGGTTTVEPKTSTSAAAGELLGDDSSCTLTAEQTEGPYYFDADAIRSDIREDRDGTLLRLAVRVRDADGCEPLESAVVDIWHCDAGGAYSGFEQGGSEEGERFLRGAQATNADGIAEFKTIYPGWYQGRTVHIHAKVHLDKQTVLTTQLYFDDEVTDRVYASAPYSEHGERDQRNDSDGIFDARMILALSEQTDHVLGAISLDVRTA